MTTTEREPRMRRVPAVALLALALLAIGCSSGKSKWLTLPVVPKTDTGPAPSTPDAQARQLAAFSIAAIWNQRPGTAWQ